MNKAITDGVVLQPTHFADVLDVWSSQNGRLTDDTYEIVESAAFVSADQDFRSCLEIQKVASTTKLR